MTGPVAGGAASVERARSETLERALGRTSGGRNIPGNDVRLLIDGPATFDAMIALIDNARESIHFENYIIHADTTGGRFAEHLGAAAGRGVTVRVLYDAWGCRGTPRQYFRALVASGVEVRPFNRGRPWRPIASIRRDHRKYASGDGARAVLGGICIGDEWAGDPLRGIPPWRDTAVEVCGPAVTALELSFIDRWRRAEESAEPVPRAAPDACGFATVRVIDGIPGHLRLYRSTALLAAAAANRIWITDAYMVAPTPIVETLIAAARDGADVRILLPGHSDLPAVRALTRVGYRELLEAGVRIWEWHGPMLHAKTFLVDERWVKIGSSNLNPSSLIANYELDVIVEERRLADAMAQQFRRDLSNAAEVVLRPRRVPAPLASRLPPAMVAADPPDRTARTRVRELPRRAAVTLRQVAGGARRSIAGAFVFTFVGAGALLIALPRIMAYLLAVVSFSLAGGAVAQYLERRHRGP